MLNTNTTQRNASPKDTLVDEVIEAFGAMRARHVRAGHHDRRDALSAGHLQVLARLHMVGPMPVSRVAATLGVSAAAATGMIGRMEDRGLVRRARDESDRRVVLVRLTAKGRTVLADIDNRGRASLARVLARLDAEELAQLRNGLRALQRAMEELADEEAVGERTRASGTACGDARPRPDRGTATGLEDADAPEDPH